MLCSPTHSVLFLHGMSDREKKVFWCWNLGRVGTTANAKVVVADVDVVKLFVPRHWVSSKISYNVYHLQSRLIFAIKALRMRHCYVLHLGRLQPYLQTGLKYLPVINILAYAPWLSVTKCKSLTRVDTWRPGSASGIPGTCSGRAWTCWTCCRSCRRTCPCRWTERRWTACTQRRWPAVSVIKLFLLWLRRRGQMSWNVWPCQTFPA